MKTNSYYQHNVSDSMSIINSGDRMPRTTRGITNPESPAQHFAYWLPGELEYSAQKAGYKEKIRRAGLHINDPQSMYNFLGSEWYQHRQLMKQGVHYMPFHGKSAQLQAAKFAAGIFDKVAVIEWLGSGADATIDNYMFEARWTGTRQGRGIYDYGDQLALVEDFSDYGDRIEDTPFDEGVVNVMVAVTMAASDKDRLRAERGLKRSYVDVASSLAHLATRYYVNYAQTYLAPEQYELPISQLAPPID